MDLSLATDRTLISENGHSTRHLHCCLVAPKALASRPRMPVDLALVLDRSGSMGGEKWQRVCHATHDALNRLEDRDRLALVLYDNEIDTLVALAPVTAALRNSVQSALALHGPRGMTNLSGGWLTGCALVGADTDTERLHRCFLLTDGLANEGITDASELSKHATELRLRGVVTSTFGVGDDYDQALLGTLSDSGGGMFHDIAAAAGIGTALDQELGDTLAVVLRAVRLEVSWTGKIRVEGIGPWPAERQEGRLSLSLGDLVSGQEQDVLVGLNFPRGTPGDVMTVRVQVLADNEVLAAAEQQWTWAARVQNDAQLRNREVDRRVAHAYATLARRDAALSNAAGNLQEARDRLQAVARRIQKYAGTDPVLTALAAQLVEEAAALHSHRMSSREAKMRYHLSASLSKGRDERGARRIRDDD